MRNGGNRFSGTLYNRGSDSLANLYLRHALFSKMQKDRQQPRQPVQAQPGMGFTVKPTEMTTGGPSSAADSATFNDRIRTRALYGAYGKGGIEREKITAQALSDMAKRMMTPKDRADIALKKKEHDLRAEGKWNWKGDEFGGGTSGTETTPVAGTGQSLGGERIGGTPAPVSGAPVPVAQAPSLRDVVPATGPSAVPENLNMMNMPSGAGMITRRNPDGSTEYLTTGLPGGAQVADAEILPGRPDEAPGLREVVQNIIAAAAKQPAAKENNVASLKDVARAKNAKKTGGDAGIGALAEVLKDMFYRAPAQAVGEENIAAAGNTLADMVWRAPMRTAGRGANWLSKYALGGLR